MTYGINNLSDIRTSTNILHRHTNILQRAITQIDTRTLTNTNKRTAGEPMCEPVISLSIILRVSESESCNNFSTTLLANLCCDMPTICPCSCRRIACLSLNSPCSSTCCVGERKKASVLGSKIDGLLLDLRESVCTRARESVRMWERA